MRVSGSSESKISSSWTLSLTWASASRPPSGSFFAPCPGVSSTYVSPSSVFCRSFATVSACSGANSRSSSIVATVRLRSPSTSSLRTLPTETPAIRTSASVASVVASGKATFTR